MKEKKQNEEIQSRREFFKKTAIGILPILGGILVSCTGRSSSIGNAIEKSTSFLSDSPENTEEDVTNCAGCNNRCMNSCFNTCYKKIK